MSKDNSPICTARMPRPSPCDSRPSPVLCNVFLNRSSGMNRNCATAANKSWLNNTPRAKPSGAWTSPASPRAAKKPSGPRGSTTATEARSTTVWWECISVTPRPAFKSCWIARCTCRRSGPTTPRAEKNVCPRRRRVPHQAADRTRANRSRVVQRHSRVGLDVRRVVRSRRQVPRRLGIAQASLRGRDPLRLSWLAAKAEGAAKGSETFGKRRSPQEVSPPGVWPAVLRSPQLADVIACLSRAVVATVPHQRYEQRAGGVGSQMGGILAQGRRWFADSAALFDRGSQCVDARSEVLLVQPPAGRTQSRHGPVRDVALAAARRLRTLVDRELLSRGKGRTRIGSLRSPGLALRASSLLCDAVEPSVLCSRASGIRRTRRRIVGPADGGTSPQRDERVAGLCELPAALPASELRGRAGKATVPPKPQQAGVSLAHENPAQQTACLRHRRRQAQIRPPRAARIITYNASTTQFTTNNGAEVALSN